MEELLKSSYPIFLQWQGCEYGIDQFFQADAEQNRNLAEWIRVPRSSFVFATDAFDNYYFVKANDNAIYFWDHNGGDVTIAFESADDFWKVLQTPILKSV
jgi:hypothetical protein